MSKEDTLKIGLALQGIALSLPDEYFNKVKDNLKTIEEIVLKEVDVEESE